MKNYSTFVIGVLVVLGAYLGSYFSLSETSHIDVTTQPDNPWIIRTYPQEWMTKFYRPAGNMEGWAKGTFVLIKDSLD